MKLYSKIFLLCTVVAGLGFARKLDTHTVSDDERRQPVLQSLPPEPSPEEAEAAANFTKLTADEKKAAELAAAQEKLDHAQLRIDYNFASQFARYKFLVDAEKLISKSLDELRMNKKMDPAEARKKYHLLSEEQKRVEWKRTQIELTYGRTALRLPPVQGPPGTSPEVLRLADEARHNSEIDKMDDRLRKMNRYSNDFARATPKTRDEFVKANPKTQKQMIDGMLAPEVKYEEVRITPDGEIYMTGILKEFTPETGFKARWAQVPLVEKDEGLPGQRPGDHLLEPQYNEPKFNELAKNSPIPPGAPNPPTLLNTDDRFSGEYTAGKKPLIQPLTIEPKPPGPEPVGEDE